MTATLHHNTFQRLPQIVAWPLFIPTPSANNAQGSHWGGSCPHAYTFKMITSLKLPLTLLLLKHAQSFLCAQPLIRDDCVPNSWKSRTCCLLTHRLKYFFLNYICCPPITINNLCSKSSARLLPFLTPFSGITRPHTTGCAERGDYGSSI